MGVATESAMLNQLEWIGTTIADSRSHGAP
jgi:hypothetical protein